MLNNIYCPNFDTCLYEWLNASAAILETIDFSLSLTYATPEATYSLITNDDVKQWLANHLHWKFMITLGADDTNPPPTEYATSIGHLMIDLTNYYRRHMWSIGAFFDEIHAGHNPLETGWANSKTTRTFEGLGFSDTKETYSTSNAVSGKRRDIAFTAPTSLMPATITVAAAYDTGNDWDLTSTSKTSTASAGETTQGKTSGTVTFDSTTGLPVEPSAVTGTKPKTTVNAGAFDSAVDSTGTPMQQTTESTGDIATRNSTGATNTATQSGASTGDAYNFESLNHSQDGSEISETESVRGDTDMIARFLEYYKVDFVNMLLDGFLREYCWMSETECDYNGCDC